MPTVKNFKEKARKMRTKISRVIDDINLDIAHFLDYGPAKDGIFANLIVPAIVAFAVALFVIASTQK